MRKKKGAAQTFEELEGLTRPLERRTFGLVGIKENDILELKHLFETADRKTLISVLREEAGHPWAARSLDQMWDTDEGEARKRGLFDLVWHRRAMEIDPVMVARNFTGFDILLDVALQVDPRLGALLSHIDPNDLENERAIQGPDWSVAWHEAAGSKSAGWLDRDEVRMICDSWGSVATPEVEEACLSLMGATFTHSGCWSLLSELGGFFGQCASENRVVVVEVDG